MFSKLKKNLKVKAKAMGKVGKEKVSDKFSGLKKKSRKLYKEYKKEEIKIRAEMNRKKDKNINVLVAYYDDDNRIVKTRWKSLRQIRDDNPVDLMRVQEKEVDGVTCPVLYKEF